MPGKRFKNVTEEFLTVDPVKEAPRPADLQQNESAQEIKAPAETPGVEYDVPKGYRLVKETKTRRLHITTTPSTAEALMRIAKAQGVSLNALCNKLFNEYIKAGGADR